MRKSSVFMLVLIVLSMPANAIEFDIPLQGDIRLSLSLNNASLDATFASGAIFGTDTLQVERSGNVIGTINFQYRFSESASGELVLPGFGTINFQPDAVNDKARFLTLTFGTQTDISAWQSQPDELFRNKFTTDIRSEGTQVGTLSAEFIIGQIPLPGTSSDEVTLDGSKVGALSTISSVDLITRDDQIVTNYFAGFILKQTGTPPRAGTVTAVSPEGEMKVPIQPIGSDRAGYGLNSTPIAVQGPVGMEVFFFVDEKPVKAVKITTDTKVRRIDLDISASQTNNFPDQDIDGVPDDEDSCPDSESTQVDERGCTCAQYLRDNPLFVCTFGSSTGAELTTAGPTCETEDSCMGTKPQYCNKNKTLVNDCANCGCPSGYSCAADDQVCPEGEQCINDGNCYKVTETVGLKCLTNDYVMGKGLDCATLGENYYDFFANPQNGDLSQYIRLRARDSNYFAQGGGKAIKQIQKMLRLQRLCIKTEDYGCVPSTTKCAGEEEFLERRSQVLLALQHEIDAIFGKKRFRSDVGSTVYHRWFTSFPLILGPIIAAIGAAFTTFKVEFYVHAERVQEVSLRVPYACEQTLLPSTQGCKQFLYSGDSEDHIDLLFIGSGFERDLEFNETLTKLLDLTGNRTATREEGLFSRAPFKANKARFNIWVVNGQNINHSVRANNPGAGQLPTIPSITPILANCPQYDHVIVLSKNNFRNTCESGSTMPCYLSLAQEPFPGRQLLRIASKRIGKLSDEFYFEIQTTDSPSRIEEFDTLGGTGPNCQDSLQTAKNKWANLRTRGLIVGFFDTCGGICGPQCKNYYRPTLNSALNRYDKRCLGADNASCNTGPPFDPLYIVNEQELKKAFEELTSIEDESEDEEAPVDDTDVEEEPPVDV